MKFHPGVIVALKRPTMNETEAAKALRDGDLATPLMFETNLMLVPLRFSGTGVALRSAINEGVHRRRDLYQSAAFLERCNGVPILLDHPRKATVTSDEWDRRAVGTTFLPYVKDDETWVIGRIYDEEAMERIANGELSTSPAVVFRDPSVNTKIKLEDGSDFLFEGEPTLLDHLALTSGKGVWDKGQEEVTGVRVDAQREDGIRADSQQENTMAEDNKEKALEAEKADAARKDAEEKEAAEKKADAEAGEKLDKVLAHLDSINKRMDSYDKRMDAMEGKEEKEVPEELAADKAKKDAEDEKKEEGLRADKKRKDAEEDEKEKAEKKADSDTAKRIADLEAALPRIASRIPAQMSDADYSALADAQARADSVYNQFGKRAPRPLDGETVPGYRRRIVKDLKTHSTDWKAIDADKLDDASFGVVESKVYADAEVAAHNPVDLGDDELRAVTTQDPNTGLRMTTFKGKQTFIHAMSPIKNYVTKFNTDIGQRRA